jgi:glycosyltransferase involved in cell wall biosynthesis
VELEVGAKSLVFTCVRDATQKGGGVAAVALPLHQALSALGPCYHLLFEQADPGSRVLCDDRAWRELDNASWPGLMHVHGLWFPFEVRACHQALKKGLKLVVSPHGMLDPWALKQKSWKKKIAWHLYQKRLLNKADLLIVNSEREREHVLKLGIRTDIVVIPNGVDMDAQQGEFKRQRSERTVLFLSRIAPGKGLTELLEAWHRIPNKRGYTLRLVGYAQADYGQKIQGLIGRLGLSNCVSMEGPLYGREKWQAFHDADYFVLPSHSENFAIVVAEALTAGLPVITTDQTPWGRLIDDGAGWICGITSEEVERALVNAIALEQEQRELMGERARAISKDYDWNTIVSRYRDVYDWLQGAGKKPHWINHPHHP